VGRCCWDRDGRSRDDSLTVKVQLEGALVLAGVPFFSDYCMVKLSILIETTPDAHSEVVWTGQNVAEAKRLYKAHVLAPGHKLSLVHRILPDVHRKGPLVQADVALPTGKRKK
jgi:hypothetical protein